jgi:pSer/pThr/pTyr-binding forkhead associated (FHA) protein
MPRVTITVPEKTPQPYRFQLDRRSVTIGRGSENDIPIDCGSISVKHAEMRRVGGGYELRDAGSTNGIKLDGERREVIALRNGISVKLGDVAFDFVLSDEELETLSAERPLEETPVLPEFKKSPKDGEGAGDPVEAPLVESGGGGFGMILLFLILAAAAFFAGMAVRYQKETGGSLIEALQSKGEPAPPPAAPPSPAPPPSAPPPDGE